MAKTKAVKVLFHSRGADQETAWCMPLAKRSLYRVDNILFLHATPTLGDVIEAKEDAEGMLTCKRVVKPGGRFAMIVDYPRPSDFKVLVKLLRSHGVETEGMSQGRLYLAVPKSLSAKEVFQLAAARVPGLVGVHPRLGPRALPKLAPPPEKPKPVTLFDAIERNDVKAFKHAKPAALRVTNERGLSLLFIATRDGRTDIVRAVLARGFDPNPRSKKDRAPLYAAVLRNRAAEARLLLAAGAKPELAKDDDGDVAVVVAAFREELDVLRVLLETKPSLAHLSHALLEAAGVGNVTIVKLLLKHGADPDLKTRKGNSARSIAQKRKRREVLALFPKR